MLEGVKYPGGSRVSCFNRTFKLGNLESLPAFWELERLLLILQDNIAAATTTMSSANFVS